MSWKPLSELELWDLINYAWDRMTLKQRKYWEIIKVDPAKWQEPSYGELGGGFWVVAIFGNQVLWYNDIEDGFNLSVYQSYGTITEYWCNQDRLDEAVQNVIGIFESGFDSSGKVGGPESVA
ncbi:hypothetical protein [Flocculibacter collagenilyticus]|uniref:hypothetical protein n=1 Tax=Flocculibacter collagenilyticus TaxID=2744479 RepID=UPI0018F48FBA|nr:hypothetical protein [Flocculibacter collagenilyticus]